MSFRVYNPKPLAPVAEAMLKNAGIEVVGSSGPSKEDLVKDVADVDAAVIWLSPNRFDKEVIDAAKNLKLISRFGVGMEIVDVAYAQEKGIMVCNTPTSNSNSVAEHAMYLIMSCARNARFVDKQLHAGEFKSICKTSAVELEGSTLGIIGPGYIASLLAKKAKYGFGMKVIAWNPHKGSKVPEDMERVDTLEELLQRSDFVSIHTPATEETKGMIGMEQLKQMKPTSFLINTSRGVVVKEDELAQALREGVIKGAGLDVFEIEPLPMESSLRNMDNVILTPHYAGFTKGAVVKTGIDVAQSLIDVMNGERPKYELKRK